MLFASTWFFAKSFMRQIFGIGFFCVGAARPTIWYLRGAEPCGDTLPKYLRQKPQGAGRLVHGARERRVTAPRLPSPKAARARGEGLVHGARERRVKELLHHGAGGRVHQSPSWSRAERCWSEAAGAKPLERSASVPSKAPAGSETAGKTSQTRYIQRRLVKSSVTMARCAMAKARLDNSICVQSGEP